MSDTPTMPPLVAIKEANTHLHALHTRNQDLEKEVTELRSILTLKLEQEEQLVHEQQVRQQQLAKQLAHNDTQHAREKKQMVRGILMNDQILCDTGVGS